MHLLPHTQALELSAGDAAMQWTQDGPSKKNGACKKKKTIALLHIIPPNLNVNYENIKLL
jgi:hypothetical protein